MRFSVYKLEYPKVITRSALGVLFLTSAVLKVDDIPLLLFGAAGAAILAAALVDFRHNKAREKEKPILVLARRLAHNFMDSDKPIIDDVQALTRTVILSEN